MEEKNKEVIFAMVKASTLPATRLDLIKAKILNFITPRQAFIGSREDYEKFKAKHNL